MVVLTTTPARSDAQRLAALARGNEIRTYRANLKRDIRARRSSRSARDVIATPVLEEETWKVFDLLLALPKIGRVKANRILKTEGISPSKTIAGLSGRQRNALLRALS